MPPVVLSGMASHRVPSADPPISRVLRVFVIGQSPRPEVEAEIAAAAPGLAIQLEGALDGMTRGEIAAHAAPHDDADSLFTALPSGELITLSKHAVAQRLADRLAGRGPALLCCTGAFKGLPARADIVQPSSVLNGLSAALLPAGTLGLFVPLPEQVAGLSAERSRPGLRAVAICLRPISSEAAIDEAAALMAETQPDLVIMDCMSYTRADKARVERTLRCPVLLSIAVAARAAASLLPETP